jgi:phosphoglycerate dehydrogenase-like enzyme
MLAKMRPTSYLVNCSDSAVIELESLVDILRNHKIAGAAFDVFETHPVAPDNPLLSLDNVILSPHIGGATDETVERHSRMMADDILRFMDGQRPVNLVNSEAWTEHGD